VSATADLLSNYQHVIESLTLRTGTKGVYDVVVDGELIYSKAETGRHAEPGEVLELFTALVGDIRRYGDD
jgi:selenoprotein W-related protein